MKRKTSNILIGVLIAVIVFCGIMAIGTFNGWFAGDKEEAVSEETTVQEETTVPEEETATDVKEQAEETKAQVQEQAASTANQCTIAIKCDSVLKHMDKLEAGKEKYVPANGIILSKSTVEFKDGNTVYDVLRATCSATGINISARNSSMGVYVEGINNLFEFDCGGTSGWMYSVNGSSPNHSCSEHKLENGDSIVWYYTCGK